MSDASETFFTSVGCMDGRVQDPVAEYGRKRFGVNFADTITEAGLVGQLVKVDSDQKLIESIKFKVFDVSFGKHHSKGIVVHGHQECAGNPVDDETHKKDILKAAELILSIDPNLSVIPVFVEHVDGEWKVKEI